MGEKHDADVLIVGAGVTGLMAANVLTQAGRQVLLLDRSHRVGGRLSTRRIGPGLADHGAQFFTVRTPEFEAWVRPWIDEGLVYEWSRGWSDGSLGTTPPEGHPRYTAQGGMSALAERLARGLDVQLETRLVSLVPAGRGWRARDDKNQVYTTRSVLLTPPVPHALEILDTAEIALDPSDRSTLQRIEYAPCLAGLFWVDGNVRLPEPGAVQRPNATITWIADNQRKGLTSSVQVITVHAGPEYSRQLWPLPDWQVLVALESGLRLFKDYDAHTVEAHLERWRYALPTVTHPERYLRAKDLPPLLFAGDAFGGPRVEGAALSGLAAGAALSARAPA
jgi:predicted NAD/FAD-dependent oxidoreductase